MQLHGQARIMRDDSGLRARWEAARDVVPDVELDRLSAAVVDRLRAYDGPPLGVAWSGGKESMVLTHLVGRSGVAIAGGMFALPVALYYREATDWCLANAPGWVEFMDTGQDLDWLKAHPAYLFPLDRRYASDWYRIVQHQAQDEWALKTGATMLLGRRRGDGNYCGRRAGEDSYTTRKGVTRWSPMADWSLDAVYAYMQREGIGLPPYYGWHAGFYCGSGCTWPMREAWMVTKPEDWPMVGWSRVYDHEPDTVAAAAAVGLEGAAAFLDVRG